MEKKSGAPIQAKNIEFKTCVPAPRSAPLAQLFLSRKLVVISALCEATRADDLDILCQSLLSLFEAHQQQFHLIKWAVEESVQNTATPGTLFRGISVAARLVSFFCKKHGKDYLSVMLADVLALLQKDELHLEIDPMRLDSADKVKTQQMLLSSACEKLLGSLLHSAGRCPMLTNLLVCIHGIAVCVSNGEECSGTTLSRHG